MKPSLKNILGYLDLKGRRRIDALERFAYSLYLKDKLQVRFEDSSPPIISISGQSFTHRKFREHVEWDEADNREYTIFKWAQKISVPEVETLEFVYRWFGSEDPTIESFEGFKARPSVCAIYLEKHFPKYFTYFESTSKKFFKIEDMAFYASTVGAKIRLDSRSTEDDKRLATRTLGLVLALLLSRENSLAKDLALARINSEVKRARQSGDSTDELRSIEAQIDQCRQANPLRYRVFSWVKVNSLAGLFSLLGIFIAFSILIYFTLTTFLNNHENLSLVDLDGVNIEARTSDNLLERNLFLFSEIPGYLILRTPSSIDSANYWFNKAQYETSEKGLILEYLNRAIKIDSTFFAAYAFRGDVFKEQMKFDRAETEYSYAIRFGPPDAIFYYKRAQMRYQLKRSNLAFEDIEKSVVLYPDSLKYNNCYASIEMVRGAILSKLGHFERSISCYTRALQNNPNNSGLFMGRATSYENLGFLDSAINDYLEITVLRDSEYDSSVVSLAFTRTAFCYYDLSKKMASKSYKITHLNNAISFADSAVKYAPNDTGGIGLKNAFYKERFFVINDL